MAFRQGNGSGQEWACMVQGQRPDIQISFLNYLESVDAHPRTKDAFKISFLNFQQSSFYPVSNLPKKLNASSTLHYLKQAGIVSVIRGYKVEWSKRSGRSGVILDCAICDYRAATDYEARNHRKSIGHRAKTVAVSMTDRRADWEANKGNVTVSSPQITGVKIHFGEEVLYRLVVENRGGMFRHFRFCNVFPLSFDECIQLRWGGELSWHSNTLPITPPIFPANTSRILHIRAKGTRLGQLKAIVVFDFSHFKIGRYIDILVEDSMMKSMAPVSPFQRSPKPKQIVPRDAMDIVPGVKPDFQPRNSLPLPPLPQFRIPSSLRDVANAVDEHHPTVRHLRDPLVWGSYKRRFETLLHLEELQQEVDIRAYDMQGKTMFKSGKYWALLVPGLAERRPSVAKGDSVFITTPRRGQHRTYEGCVHVVRKEEVLMLFAPSFDYIANECVDVQFSFNRLILRRCHLGLSLAQSHVTPNALLPTNLPPGFDFQPGAPEPADLPRVPLISPRINAEQQLAVRHILRRSAIQRSPFPIRHMPPYLIFGPPGTGKTSTIIEALLQVLRADPGARVLACAPSNSAADNILERLQQSFVEERHIIRVNAATRSREEMSDWAKARSLCDSALGVFLLPDRSQLQSARVVVSTCCSATLLEARGVPRGHFSHIFIDEAGHAAEPEGLLPIACCLGPTTTLVLVGDPHQLGPVVRSHLAKTFGLDISLMERLLTDFPIFSHTRDGALPFAGLNPHHVTKLVKNYRSHPAILKLPSTLFYQDELEACANVMVREALCSWEGLPNRNQFPVLFHGVEGRDEREGNSPSFFNPAEASEVQRYVRRLRECRQTRVALSEIGVITPYRKQVQKINTVLSQLGAGVKVGSVEEFQGQERRVIIISTVRSSAQFVEFDALHNLGFLANCKRFNVAVTRAQALLIIIGNPHVLAQDKHWGAMLKYCIQNKAYVGCPPPMREEEGELEGNDLAQALAALTLTGGEEMSVEEASASNVVGLYENPEWPDPTV